MSRATNNNANDKWFQGCEILKKNYYACQDRHHSWTELIWVDLPENHRPCLALQKVSLWLQCGNQSIRTLVTIFTYERLCETVFTRPFWSLLCQRQPWWQGWRGGGENARVTQRPLVMDEACGLSTLTDSHFSAHLHRRARKGRQLVQYKKFLGQWVHLLNDWFFSAKMLRITVGLHTNKYMYHTTMRTMYILSKCKWHTYKQNFDMPK
jgi:hypothetical protein